MCKNYWLVKSEPNVFCFDDLRQSSRQTTCWDGVRNYQARVILRDKMKIGDGVFFYHSRTAPLAIMGITTVVRAGYPDPTQFDKRSPKYDAGSAKTMPRWFAVDLQFEMAFQNPVTLAAMRRAPALDNMMLLMPGSRLSVQPVTSCQFATIVAMSHDF